MEATFIHSDVLGSPTLLTALYRIFLPAQALSAAGHTIHLMQGGKQLPLGPNREEADNIDYAQVTETVLLEREAAPDTIRKLRLAGAKRIVLTFDDNYGLTPEWAPHYSYWLGPPAHYKKFLKALGQVDLAIVAGEGLVAQFADDVRDIRLVPNYLPSPWVDPEISFDRQLPAGKAHLVWGGTLEHRGTWEGSPVPKALRAARTELPGLIEFDFINHVADRYLEAAGLMSYQPHEWVGAKAWPKYLSQFHIGLAPLRGEYDQGRSSLKVLEYASLGLPWLASEGSPYWDAEGGILIPSDRREGERWTAAIRTLVTDPILYADLSARGRAWAAGYQMNRNVGVYEEALWPAK